jgi:hypothetical protein
MKANRISAVSLFGLLLCAAALPAPAQSTNADFQQAVTEFQQSPSFGTYEKVIKTAAAMDRLQPIPTEARRHFVMGATLAKDAKTPDDFIQVSDEFSQAVRLAPWWPEALYNLALARGAAGYYAQGIADLKYYQLFKLSDAEAQAAQEKSWAFEAKQAKAVKDKELPAEEAASTRELAAQKGSRTPTNAQIGPSLSPQDKLLGRWHNTSPLPRGEIHWLGSPTAYDSIEFLANSMVIAKSRDTTTDQYQMIGEGRLTMYGYVFLYIVNGNSLTLTDADGRNRAIFSRQ